MSLLGLRKTLERKKKSQENFEEAFLLGYEKALVKDAEEHTQPTPTEAFRPSSLGGCKRMLYYMRKGVEANDKVDPTLIGICDSGTDRHTRIQNMVAKIEGLEVLDIEQLVKDANVRGINTQIIGWNKDHTECRCYNEDLSIYFQCDGAFTYRDKRCLLEVKTESSFTFQNRHAPKDYHLYQVTAYAMGLGMDHVLFLYEDRNFTKHKAYLIKIDDELKNRLTDKIDYVNSCLETNTVPPKETDKCTYCKYKAQCKKDC